MTECCNTETKVKSFNIEIEKFWSLARDTSRDRVIFLAVSGQRDPVDTFSKVSSKQSQWGSHFPADQIAQSKTNPVCTDLFRQCDATVVNPPNGG